MQPIALRRLCGIIAGVLLLVAPGSPGKVAAQATWQGAVPMLASLGAERCTIAEPSPECRLLTDLLDAARTSSGDAVWRVLQRAEAFVVRDHSSALTWFALGTARWMAHDLAIPAHAAPLQDLGESYPSAASNAFIRAFEIDSTLTGALEAVAFLPLPREGASRLQSRSDFLWHRRNRLSPAALASSASVQREAGQLERAIDFRRGAIASGTQSLGPLQLEMARDHFALGDTAAGTDSYYRGATDTTADAVTAYRRQLVWVATPAELASWDSLAPGARADWLRGFWLGRDATAGRPPGARLSEHFRRLELALRDYRLTLPASGRHLARSTARAAEFLPVELALRDLRILGPTGNEQADAANAELLQFVDGDVVTMAGGSMLAAYRPQQDLIDDRGVVFLRHGAPDARARTVGGISLELWRYDLGGTPMILSFKEVDFDGQAAASVLVPSLIGEDALLRDQVCHLDTAICSNNVDPVIHDAARSTLNRQRADASRYRSGVTIARLRDQGLAAIERAVTTDGNPVEPTARLHPLVQLYALRNIQTGVEFLVASFAVSGKELTAERPATAAGRHVYPLRLRLTAARRSDGTWRQLDTLRQFATAAPLSDHQYLTGSISTPIGPGTWTASLGIATGGAAATAANGRAGAVLGRALWVSDLVLGRVGSGATWFSGTRQVPLNPLNTFRSSDAVSLYYQFGGVRRGDTVTVRIEIVELDRESSGPVVALSFRETVSAGLMESNRTIGVATLSPGRYRVRVTLSGIDDEVSNEGRLVIVK